MNRPMKFRLAVVSMVILLYPFSASFAKEVGQAKVDVESGLSNDALKDEDAIKEGTPRSTRLDEQDRYHRMLIQYVHSFNKAESDEERNRLRRKFDEDTREYKNSLAEEKEDLKKRDIEKERQALENEYHEKLRRLEQNHDKKVRRLEQERSELLIGADKNWSAQERAMGQKKPLLEVEFQRRLKLLKNEYNASLRELQRKK